MAGVRPLGEDMDEDDPVAGLHQVVDRPPRRGLALRRLVHAHANGSLPSGHVSLSPSLNADEFLVESPVNEGCEAGREESWRRVVEGQSYICKYVMLLGRVRFVLRVQFYGCRTGAKYPLLTASSRSLGWLYSLIE